MNPNLKYCTLTGADDRTSIAQLNILSKKHPIVEWGILFSEKEKGNGRYPSLEWIDSFINKKSDSLNCALHICGKEAISNFIDNTGRVSLLVNAFQRVQLNFRAADYPVTQIKKAMRRFPNKTFITQYNQANEWLWQALKTEPNHVVLFDGSGGRGKEATHFPKNLYPIMCGYAGGLGENNLKKLYPIIQSISNPYPFWIDMETSLRNSLDLFDLNIAQRILQIIESNN